MPAPTRNSSLSRSHEFGHMDCRYNLFNNTQNATDFTVLNISSQCGFNSGDDAYCPAHKGDNLFKNYAQEVTQIYSGDLKCNPDSNEMLCQDFINAHGTRYNQIKFRAFYSLAPQGNANIR
jgi:hypothetical protein